MAAHLEGTVAIEDLLSSSEKTNKERYKTVEVTKTIEPQLDIGNLLVVDQDPIENSDLRKDREEALKSLARDNTQVLFNSIWKLPIERSENIVVVKLPEGATVLPREKPIPKAKPLTKWQEFAKRKGIVKTKRGRMLWDEASKTWKPRWGFKRANDKTKDWLIEVPDNADPYEDQFLKRENAKKERVAKNEFQRLRNVARSQKGSKASNLTPSEKPNRDQMKATINAARMSTASMGKFTPKVQHEVVPKKTGKKRKFEPVAGNSKTEKQRNLELFDRIGKRPTLDVTKAANQQITSEQNERSRQNKGKSKKSTRNQGQNPKRGKGNVKQKGKKGRK